MPAAPWPPIPRLPGAGQGSESLRGALGLCPLLLPRTATNEPVCHGTPCGPCMLGTGRGRGDWEQEMTVAVDWAVKHGAWERAPALRRRRLEHTLAGARPHLASRAAGTPSVGLSPAGGSARVPLSDDPQAQSSAQWGRRGRRSLPRSDCFVHAFHQQGLRRASCWGSHQEPRLRPALQAPHTAPAPSPRLWGCSRPQGRGVKTVCSNHPNTRL